MGVIFFLLWAETNGSNKAMITVCVKRTWRNRAVTFLTLTFFFRRQAQIWTSLSTVWKGPCAFLSRFAIPLLFNFFFSIFLIALFAFEESFKCGRLANARFFCCYIWKAMPVGSRHSKTYLYNRHRHSIVMNHASGCITTAHCVKTRTVKAFGQLCSV